MTSAPASNQAVGPSGRRLLLKRLAAFAFAWLCHLRIEGRENLPDSGPLIITSNHLHFGDPAAIVHLAPWPVEFIGDSVTPNAPPLLSWIRRLWGIILIRRGGISREGLMAAAAFLADRTGAAVLPVGLVGMENFFASLLRGRRADVVIRVGQPCGPFSASGKGQRRRRQIDAIGHRIMRRIAALIPPHQRGFYSEEPVVRAAAAEACQYPWAAGG